MTITYALIQMVEKISERSDLARIINKASGNLHISVVSLSQPAGQSL